MNYRVKKRWIKELRSGVYKKTCCSLRHGDRFCVLGVLCDLHAKATGGEWEGGHYKGRGSELPDEVRYWAGLEGYSAMVGLAPLESKYESLAQMNDGVDQDKLSARSFKQIANCIERHL